MRQDKQKLCEMRQTSSASVKCRTIANFRPTPLEQTTVIGKCKSHPERVRESHPERVRESLCTLREMYEYH
eukprot:936202-Amphidinium_carterae.1